MQVRHLSEEFIKQAKEKLLEKQQELTKELDLLKSEDPYLADDHDDNGEVLDEAMTEDMVKETIDIQMVDINKSLDQVEKALEKIEEGTYGICEETGEPIDKARLEVYPEATTGIDA
jgi:DnaK suppressor protein